MSVDIKLLLNKEMEELKEQSRMDMVRGSGSLQVPKAYQVGGYDTDRINRWNQADDAVAHIRRLTPHDKEEEDNRMCLFLLGFNRTYDPENRVGSKIAMADYMHKGTGPFTADDCQMIDGLLREWGMESVSWLLGFRFGGVFREVSQLTEMLSVGTDD